MFRPGANAVNTRTKVARRQIRNVKSGCVHKSFSRGLARHEDGVVPFIALRIELREIVPLRLRFERFKAGVACEGAKTVRKKSPAIGGKTMFRSAGGLNDAAEAVRLKNWRDL